MGKISVPLGPKEVKELIDYCRANRVLKITYEGIDLTFHPLAFTDAKLTTDFKSRMTETKPNQDDDLLFASA